MLAWSIPGAISGAVAPRWWPRMPRAGHPRSRGNHGTWPNTNAETGRDAPPASDPGTWNYFSTVSLQADSCSSA